MKGAHLCADLLHCHHVRLPPHHQYDGESAYPVLSAIVGRYGHVSTLICQGPHHIEGESLNRFSTTHFLGHAEYCGYWI